MKYHFSLLVTLVFIVLIQCTSKEHLNLTSEYLNGNWYYIDSICNPDSEYEGYNYVEVSFNDSILISNSGALNVLEIEQNKMKINFECVQKVQFELTRMKIHEHPLKEFYNHKEWEDFGRQVRNRQYSTLTSLGLIK